MIAENIYWRRRRDFLRFYVKKPVKSTQFSICRDQFASCRRAKSARWRGKKDSFTPPTFFQEGRLPPESAAPALTHVRLLVIRNKINLRVHDVGCTFRKRSLLLKNSTSSITREFDSSVRWLHCLFGATVVTGGGMAPSKGGGHHRFLTSFLPCNAHRVNVKISHPRGHGAAPPPPFRRL